MADASVMYQQVLSRLSGGGDTLKADLADIEAGKKSAVATGTQNLISGGLGGTTVMGAVPLAAEKTAGRARLRARGGAEEKYLSVLTSFANLAESSKQQELNRQTSRSNAMLDAQTSLQMGGQPVGGTTQNPITTYGGSFGFGADASNRPGWGFDTGGTGSTGGGNAQQFPSIYGTQTGGGLPSTPNWTGSGGGDIDWEAKRLADNAQAQKLQSEGRLTFGPEQLEQNTQQQVTAGLPQSAQAPKQSEEERITASFIATGKWKMGPNGQLMRA